MVQSENIFGCAGFVFKASAHSATGRGIFDQPGSESSRTTRLYFLEGCWSCAGLCTWKIISRLWAPAAGERRFISQTCAFLRVPPLSSAAPEHIARVMPPRQTRGHRKHTSGPFTSQTRCKLEETERGSRRYGSSLGCHRKRSRSCRGYPSSTTSNNPSACTRADLRKYGVTIGCSACSDTAVHGKTSKPLTEERIGLANKWSTILKVRGRRDVGMLVEALESASVKRGSDAVADSEERARLRLRVEGKRGQKHDMQDVLEPQATTLVARMFIVGSLELLIWIFDCQCIRGLDIGVLVTLALAGPLRRRCSLW